MVTITNFNFNVYYYCCYIYSFISLHQSEPPITSPFSAGRAEEPIKFNPFRKLLPIFDTLTNGSTIATTGEMVGSTVATNA